MQTTIHVMYMVASVLFIVGIKRLSAVKTARSANALSALGMLLAILAAMMDIAHQGQIAWIWVGIGLVAGSGIGAYLALTVKMEGMPELVGFFNGMGGLGSCLVAVSMSVFAWISWGEALPALTAGQLSTTGILSLPPAELARVLATQADAPRLTTDNAITMVLSILVGGVTLTGSLIAWAKLKGVMKGGQIFLPGHQLINLGLLIIILAAGTAALFLVPLSSTTLLYGLLVIAVVGSFVLGVTFAIPVGGADMPVVISLLNSFSGIAAAMTGFVLYNNLLIISGSLVGAAGMILTIIMCRGMNRSLANVLFARFSLVGGEKEEYVNVKSGDPVDAAISLANASNVIIVPGYGLAAAQAQHAVRELADMLEERGVNVRYAIHEVAGRMPGHMNVLLAEANVPYEQLFKREDIQSDFKNTDVVLVIGANDVVNPAALSDENSPLHGMPILPAHEAQQAFVIKRSLAAGFAGMKNTLFESDRTLMIFGSAKEVVSGISAALKEQ
jgi:NAD(P) transhydrogenase subunit beta